MQSVVRSTGTYLPSRTPLVGLIPSRSKMGLTPQELQPKDDGGSRARVNIVFSSRRPPRLVFLVRRHLAHTHSLLSVANRRRQGSDGRNRSVRPRGRHERCTSHAVTVVLPSSAYIVRLINSSEKICVTGRRRLGVSCCLGLRKRKRRWRG